MICFSSRSSNEVSSFNFRAFYAWIQLQIVLAIVLFVNVNLSTYHQVTCDSENINNIIHVDCIARILENKMFYSLYELSPAIC